MAGGSTTEDLNLVPYLDIVTTLTIAMLIMGVAATEGLMLVAEPVDVPSLGPGSGHTSVLAVHLDDAGYLLAGDGGSLRVPRAPSGEPAYAELTRTLREVHDHGGAEARASFSADVERPFTEVVGTLDAMRRDPAGPLYPSVILATPPADR